MSFLLGLMNAGIAIGTYHLISLLGERSPDVRRFCVFSIRGAALVVCGSALALAIGAML